MHVVLSLFMSSIIYFLYGHIAFTSWIWVGGLLRAHLLSRSFHPPCGPRRNPPPLHRNLREHQKKAMKGSLPSMEAKLPSPMGGRLHLSACSRKKTSLTVATASCSESVAQWPISWSHACRAACYDRRRPSLHQRGRAWCSQPLELFVARVSLVELLGVMWRDEILRRLVNLEHLSRISAFGWCFWGQQVGIGH